MRVIITGANGFIGSSLVKKFYDNGDEVFSIVKDEKENIENIKDYSQIFYNNFNNLEALYDSLKSDKECVFYHFAWIGVNGSLKADYNSQIKNIKMACDCANLASKLNCKRFLIAGTVAENAVDSFKNLEHLNGGLMYSVSKKSTHMFIEMYCKNIGLPFVWMQYSNIYGPSNKTGNLVSYTLTQLLNDKEATFGPASQPYDFIFINDLIDASYKLSIAKKLNHSEYFIGSGKPRILKDYLIYIGKVMNKEQLIKINVREDDGIKYNLDMFDISKLVKDIGNFISMDFEKAIEFTIENF